LRWIWRRSYAELFVWALPFLITAMLPAGQSGFQDPKTGCLKVPFCNMQPLFSLSHTALVLNWVIIMETTEAENNIDE
jgi:hypothetical protein